MKIVDKERKMKKQMSFAMVPVMVIAGMVAVAMMKAAPLVSTMPLA